MSNQEIGQPLAMTSAELARELRLSPLTISRLERHNPGALPPVVVVGRGKRLYPRHGVLDWFNQKSGITTTGASAAPRVAEHCMNYECRQKPEKRGPGRPRKMQVPQVSRGEERTN